MTGPGLGLVIQHLRRLVDVSCHEATDQELLGRFARQQDEAAFEALVARHGRLVYGVCRRILQDDHEAEDAFQAVFLILARRAGSVAWQTSVAGWLHQVAHRLALRARSQRSRQQTLAERQAERTMARLDSPTTWHDLEPVLDQELLQLPARYRVPLVLHYLEGKSPEETAQELGCGVGVVRGRLWRGRDMLRDRLARRGLTFGPALLASMLAESAVLAAPPASLLASTVQAGIDFAAGSLAGAVSAHALTLANGGLQTMFLAKIKIAAVALLALSTCGTGAAVLARSALHAGYADTVIEKPVENGQLSAVAELPQATEVGQQDPEDELKKRQEELKKLLEQLSYRRLDNRLGIVVKEPAKVIVDQLGLPEKHGLIIEKVNTDSAAAKAGLQPSDILLELDGKPVPSSVIDFLKMVDAVKPNTPVDGLILRKGKKETIKGIALPEAKPRGSGTVVPLEKTIRLR